MGIDGPDDSEITGDGLPLEGDGFLEGVPPSVLGNGDLVVLYGQLGPGLAPGEWRLYQTIEFDQYYVVTDADVVFRRRTDGASFLWVKEGTPLTLVRGGASGFEQEVLAGELSGLAAQAPPSGAGWLARETDVALLPPAVEVAASLRRTLSGCH